MTAWLRRNMLPILATVAAAALVIVALEAIDAIIASPDLTTINGTAEAEGAAPVLAGMVKVGLLLAVPAGVTLAVRRKGETATKD